MGEHTPGPWVVMCNSQGYPYQIYAPNGSRGPGGIRSVTRWASIGLPSSAEGKANAALIADAPRLKAVNDALVKALNQFLENHLALVASGDCGFWDAETEQQVIDARAALRAATPDGGDAT